MISNFQQPVASKVCANDQKISFSEILSKLSGICEQRYHAYSLAARKTYQIDQKLKAIAIIRVELEIAKLEMNTREAYKRCLRTEVYFKEIAKRSSPEAHQKYIAKLEIYMAACRTYLGWRSQNAA